MIEEHIKLIHCSTLMTLIYLQDDIHTFCVEHYYKIQQ